MRSYPSTSFSYASLRSGRTEYINLEIFLNLFLPLILFFAASDSSSVYPDASIKNQYKRPLSGIKVWNILPPFVLIEA